MFSNLFKIQTVFIFFYCLQTVSLSGQETNNNPDKQVIAVLKFKNNTDVFAYDRHETGIPEMLKTELSQYNKLVVVERENIESRMSSTDATEEWYHYWYLCQGASSGI